MKYRARLIDPGNTVVERPVEVFSHSRFQLEAWARTVLKKALSDQAAVLLYQSTEVQIAIIPKASIEGGGCVSSSQVTTGPGSGKDAGPGQTEGEA
jgi:hypothetical protein